MTIRSLTQFQGNDSVTVQHEIGVRLSDIHLKNHAFCLLWTFQSFEKKVGIINILESSKKQNSSRPGAVHYRMIPFTFVGVDNRSESEGTSWIRAAASLPHAHERVITCRTKGGLGIAVSLLIQ